MNLTDEQRRLGRKSCILAILQNDVVHKQFNDIQKLYETANIQNQELIEQFDSQRNVGHPFFEMIFWDIALLLSEKIIQNSELEDLFQKLSESRYVGIKRLFEKYKTQYASNMVPAETIRSIKNLGNYEIKYFKYNMYCYDFNWFTDEVWQQDIQSMEFGSYLSDRSYMEQVHNRFIFEGTNESIFSSKLFDKYISKRKNDLAEYLNVPVDKLEKMIHEEMKSHANNSGIPLRTDVYGVIENATKAIISRIGGGTCWYEHMTAKRYEYEGGLGYEPDVDAIIRDYYISMVQAKYIDYTQKKIPFTKIVLSRECKSDNIKEDYLCILCLYEMDVLYKMFSLMMKKYYQDFSWEKIVKYNLELRYNSIIESLKKMIADKDLELESCFRQQSIQTEKISADKDELIKPFVIENNKLNKRIDAQAVEIIKLQKQIRIQNEYIAEFQKPELPPIEENVDLELLQRKRYLFVGRADEALPELKH